jgi:hypothetical protein
LTDIKNDAFQSKIKELLNMTYLTKAKLDPFSANMYLLKDILKNNQKTTLTNLGWENPTDIPFNPDGLSYQGPTSGSRYNQDKINFGDKKVMYDFNAFFASIMRNYSLPSNTFLSSVKMTHDKIIDRLDSYASRYPYKNLKTFVFVKIDIHAAAKPGVHIDTGSMLYGWTKVIYQKNIVISEIELKIICDYYDVKDLKIIDSYVFRCRNDLFVDYFDRIDILASDSDQDVVKFHKGMRNRLYGLVGKHRLTDAQANVFSIPIYNRACASFVGAVARDIMLRLEQKYVNSEYDMFMIKTDGIYFKREVPEFEKLLQAGVVKKEVSTIDNDDIFSN